MPGRAGSSWPGIFAAARVRGGPGGSFCLRPGSRGAGPGVGSFSGSGKSGGSGGWGSGGVLGSKFVPSVVSSI